MDQKNTSKSVAQSYALLALCARAEGHSVFYEQLASQIEQFSAWHTLPGQAALHGMGPLLWHHLRQAKIDIPAETELTLRGLYLRERTLNQAHMLTLVEMQNIFAQSDIHPLVLKGLALAYKYYPDPALRPVSDIDLLLKKDDVLPAMRALKQAGYHIKLPNSNLQILPSELTAHSPSRNGISTYIELHHYDPKHRLHTDFIHDEELKDFSEAPQILTINGCDIHIPSPTDMLHYVTKHMVRHLFVSSVDIPLPLKWSADILSVVEYHAEEIDWADIQRTDSPFLRRLEVLYSQTPLLEKYQDLIPVRKIDPPLGINQYPALPDWKRIGLWRTFWLSFQTPSAWWLRLYYGTDEQGVFWYGQIVYRLRALRWILRTTIRRIFFR
ncbi:MAG: nucleotidyltransferase family protein [Chloroflexi bacterium]|nr:nucleotidyltransferase family protein [Chloroflexota bacterium]